jgi:hypothetical protein
MSLSIHLRDRARIAACGVLAAGAVLGASGTAHAAPAAQQPTNKTLKAAPAQLAVWSAPRSSGGAYVGDLVYGQNFRVQRYSPSGRWAYGRAGGDARRNGWVLAVGLQGARPKTPTPLSVCVAAQDVTGQAGGGPVIGTLHRRDSFSVIRFSGQGQYAYGIAGGDVDKPAWTFTSSLCQF